MLQSLAQLNSTRMLALFPFLLLTLSLLCVFGRKIALSNPPTDRMRDVHKLHITQSVPMLDEN